MRYLFFVLCWLALPFLAVGQEHYVDFGTKLNEAKSDSEKAFVYKDALIHYYRGNSDTFKFYADEAIAYFRKKNYSLGEGIIVAQLGLTDRAEGRVLVALKRFHYALDIFRKEHYTRGMADLLGNIGGLEAGRGNIDVAAKYITESLRMQEAIGNRSGLMIGYMNLGSMYLQQNDTANATLFLNKASAISRDLPLTVQIIGLYNMVGVLYAMKGDNEKALACFLNNLELSNKYELLPAQVECISYIAEYYQQNGNPEKAFQYLRDGLKLTTEHNLAEMKSNMLLTMASLLQDKDPESAVQYMNEALEIGKQMDNKSFMATVYDNQAAIYKKLGKFKEALFATEMKNRITDSIFSIRKSRELASISSAYELEKSNEKVNELQRENSRNERQRNVLLVIAIGVILLLATLWRFYQKTVLLNRQLAAHQAEMSELNTMKDKLFSIIGHDLRGPLARIPTILDIYEDPATDAAEKKYLLDSLREHTCASMDMLEKLLFWGQALVKGVKMKEQKVAIKTVVADNIDLYAQSVAEKSIVVRNNVKEGSYVLADTKHFDFIVRNLLHNAIKYSHTGGVITLDTDESSRKGYTILAIKDTGTGISPELLKGIFNPSSSTPGTANERGTGIGLMLCKEFAILNGGDIWADSIPGKGSTFFLSLRNM